MTPVPKINLGKTDRLTSLFVSLLPKGTTLLYPDIDRVADRIDKNPIKVLEKLNRKHLLTTLSQYLGKVMTPRTANSIARQLAGRFAELHIMPLPVFQVVAPGWVALEIIAAKPVPWRETDYGHLFTLYALTGSMAGVTFDKKFPDSWLRGLAYKLGYSRRNTYSDNGADLIGLRFWGSIALSERDPRIPEIVDVATSSAVLKHNRLIVKRRTRLEKDLDEDPCPEASESPCAECPRTAQECAASHHRTIHLT
jgi:hypothetical protein